MNKSKRNPISSTYNKNITEVVGDLGQEIQEQDLENIDGGSTIVCHTIVSATVASPITGNSYGFVCDVTNKSVQDL